MKFYVGRYGHKTMIREPTEADEVGVLIEGDAVRVSLIIRDETIYLRTMEGWLELEPRAANEIKVTARTP